MNQTNLVAGHLNLVSRDMIPCPERFRVEIGSRRPGNWATVTQISTNRVYIAFDDPQSSARRGQTIVIFDGMKEVGNCIIE